MGNENEKLLNAVLEDLHKSTLAIPVLNGYKLKKNTAGAILVAESDDHSVEQYLEDGQLDENETSEDRLNKVLEETKEVMKKYGFEEKELQFYKSVKSDLFEYKLYLQDNIKEDTQIRQINAYFVEPDSNYFYEITLSAPPMPKEMVNDIVTENIYARLEVILRNVKYNDKKPIV